MPSDHIARRPTRRAARTFAVVAVGIAVAAAAQVAAQRPSATETRAQARFYPDDPIQRDDDMRTIPPVATFDLSKSYEFVNETFGDSSRSRGPALNINTLGEVPDSSWFTNRIGRYDMRIDEIVRGPNRVDGPADGPWQVTGRPDSGITPKFTIRDARGDTYLIKLDPASHPELPSSVEMISTKIFHAIGYHVPEDFIVTFDLSRLTIANGAKLRTAAGGRRPIRTDDVEQWLADAPRTAQGTVRALASRYVPGTVVGQFRYTGTRPDDPNDVYPHERRRELRGMRVFAAWLNHDDARSLNSIDSLIEEDGRRYIRHYVQDFGSNLGSGSTSAQQPRGGYEYLIDGGATARGLLSLGFWARDWARVRYPEDPSLGNIEAEFFEPWRWKTEYPQPAFDQMDAADAFWAARIASRFTDQMVRAVVETGQLSNPAAAQFLTDVIIRRRDKVVSYWIAGTNPLDAFAVGGERDRPELTFDNAAVRLRVADSAGYKVRWMAFDNNAGTERAIGPEADLAEPRVRVPDAAWGPVDAAGFRYSVAAIKTIHARFPHWAADVRVTLRQRDGAIDVVGIERPTETIRAGVEKLAATAKRPFKDRRPRSCKPAVRATPASSWPARGEPAMAFCAS
jgi:hypothetical protein